MHYKFICVEGNIGIGKTTLVKKLAEHTKAYPFYEEFDDNPWLPLFYKNPKDIALALELSLLTNRCQQLVQVKTQHVAKVHISDYCLDKCLLFAKTNLPADDYARYEALYKQVSASLMQPDLLIVLHTPLHNLLQNIKQRNRNYEQQIAPYYLEQLNEAYKHFFNAEKNHTTLNIHSNDLNEKAYERIFNKVVAFLSYGPVQKINHLTI